MGKEKKLSFADKLKAGLTTATAEATKIAKTGMEAATTGADSVAKTAVKSADVVAKGALKSVTAVAKKAGEAKDFVDDKSRAALDKAYLTKRPQAIENFGRLRLQNPSHSPAEILAMLENDLKVAEDQSGSDSNAFTDAVALYVFTAVEIHDENQADPNKRQLLLDSMVVIDSEVAKNVAAIGGAVLSLFAGKIGAVGKAVDAVAKTTQKLSWMKPLIDLAGIKNPGKKSATWIVTTVTKSVLGTPPTTWVEVTKTDGK